MIFAKRWPTSSAPAAAAPVPPRVDAPHVVLAKWRERAGDGKKIFRLHSEGLPLGVYEQSKHKTRG